MAWIIITFFAGILQTACCERKEKQSWWFPIVSASYTTDPPETNACFISNWSIFRMLLQRFAILHNKTNMPKGKPIRISSTFSQMWRPYNR